MFQYLYSDITDARGSRMIFEDVTQLLSIKNDKRFMSIVASRTCLTTRVLTDSVENISQIVDFLQDLKPVNYTANVAKPFLIVMTSTLNPALLKNKTINFNVVILHYGEGRNLKVK